MHLLFAGSAINLSHASYGWTGLRAITMQLYGRQRFADEPKHHSFDNTQHACKLRDPHANSSAHPQQTCQTCHETSPSGGKASCRFLSLLTRMSRAVITTCSTFSTPVPSTRKTNMSCVVSRHHQSPSTILATNKAASRLHGL